VEATRSNRVGCASSQTIVENTTVSPSGEPSSDDCYTTTPHNRNHDQGLSVSERSGKRAGGVYTHSLHIVLTHLVRKGGRIYYRRRVPEALREIVSKREVWKSLGTDSPTVALRRSLRVAATIEHEFEVARSQVGLMVDEAILSGFVRSEAIPPDNKEDAVAGLTLGEVYDAYMGDPTRDWSPTTRMAYQTTRRIVLAILGEGMPVRSITRAQCRDMIEVLRWQPRNASKLFPGLSPMEIAAKARAEQRTDLINAANLNTYLNKLGGVFNWAVKEEMLDRNPAQGLRVPDPTLRRDKRLPFSNAQLRAIFAAPLYKGCLDDGNGYATPGTQRPRNARFWIPLVSMYCGLRLNEACQLDVSDIRMFEKIACFVITERSESNTIDKRLKTASSERVVPVHPELLSLGFMEFVAGRRRVGEAKLFGEVGLGATGYRSTTFSAWFARFAAKAGASSTKTCFHSLRHGFRDALREAEVSREIALALGGWSAPGGSASVSDAYGSGYKIATLFDGLSRVRYPGLDLSHLNSQQD
jgi:integrase